VDGASFVKNMLEAALLVTLSCSSFDPSTSRTAEPHTVGFCKEDRLSWDAASKHHLEASQMPSSDRSSKLTLSTIAAMLDCKGKASGMSCVAKLSYVLSPFNPNILLKGTHIPN
jgi:hypothetical protein